MHDECGFWTTNLSVCMGKDDKGVWLWVAKQPTNDQS